MRDLLESIIKLNLKRGAEFCDIRVVENSGTIIDIENSIPKKLLSPMDYGVCCRVLYKGVWGFASTNEVNKQGLERIAENAISVAKGRVVKEKIKLSEQKPCIAKKFNKVEIPPDKISVKEKINILKELESDAQKVSNKIKNTSLRYIDNITKEIVVNSYGTYTEQTLTRVFGGIRVVAQEGDNRQFGYRVVGKLGGFEVIKNIDTKKFGIEASKTAINLLKAAKPPAGKFTVVMDPSIAGLFAHEAFGHNAEADLVIHHESIIEGMKGKYIANSMVNLIDDPTIEGEYGSYYFDSEGTPATRREIIKDGILVGHMHSLETAQKMSEPLNGSARGWLHQNIPIVRMSNTFFEPGELSFDELISDIKYGILVKGEHWGYVSTERGQFTCNIEEAQVIRNGKLEELLSGVSIGGLTLETLKNIEGMTKDFKIRLSGMCGKGQPMWVGGGGPFIRVRDVTVGGYK
jgi:TldD protein